MHKLGDRLDLLTDVYEGVELNRTASISVDKVLAVAWAPYRLDDCVQRLQRGQVPPPIYVSRRWLHGESYYLVLDGNHRTIAAQQLGRTRIKAVIVGENWCRPERYVLDPYRATLWCSVPGESYLTLVMAHLPADDMQWLEDVGVTVWR